MMSFWNKKRKASLQLSINAIVILIMAITILGLGLGFIRSQWTRLEGDLGRVSDQMQEQIENDIKESGKILAFNKLKIEITKGKEKEFYFGIKNTGSLPNCYGMEIRCIQSQKDGIDGCTQTGTDIKGGLEVGQDKWFSLFESTTVGPGDVKVLPIKVQISGSTTPDTYEMRMNIWEGLEASSQDGEPDCPDTIPTGVQTYAKKTFFVVLS